MAEIGAQLREARTRARIEIAQVEVQTKIRAKYLRALENEEWELLPGTTYTKSFLKTYGDMLGLDGRLLVAEYKRLEEPFAAEGDYGSAANPHVASRSARRTRSSLLRAPALAGAVVLAVAAGAVYAVLSMRPGEPTAPGASADGPAVVTTPTETPAPAARPVEVRVTATADGVTVCVRAGARLAVSRRKLSEGEGTPTVRGREVLVTSDSGRIRVTVDGRAARVPTGSGGRNVRITQDGVARVTARGVSACST